MNAKEKATRMNMLLDAYGALLTSTQQKIMNDKYRYDLSLQEISEHFYISRAAALDAIKVASKKLEDYEKRLHFIVHVILLPCWRLIAEWPSNI